MASSAHATDRRTDTDRARASRPARPPGDLHDRSPPRTVGDAHAASDVGGPGRRRHDRCPGMGDEALMLNLAGFGPDEHQLMIQAGIEGLHDILDVDLETFGTRIRRAAGEIDMAAPADLTLEGWWEQAKTLEDE